MIEISVEERDEGKDRWGNEEQGRANIEGLTLADFKLKATIGRGAFGKVISKYT